MRKILLVLLAVLPFLCFSQEELKVELSEQSNLSIGVLFAPEYDFRTVKSTDVVGDYLLEFSKDEKGRFGFTTGISIDYSIMKWLSFETGMMFSQKGYSKTMLLRENESEELFEGKFKLGFYYLTIPLKAKFYVWDVAAVRLYTSIGFSPDFYLSKKITLNGDNMDYYQDGSVLFNKVNLSFLGNIGARYDINSKMYLEVGASYKHALLPLNDIKLKRNLYSFGLDISMFYRL